MITKKTYTKTIGLFLSYLLFAAGAARGQGNSDNVRSLNARVLQFHAALGRANAAEAAQIQTESAPVFAQRAASLKALIREAPAAALGLAFSQDLIDDLAAKFPASVGLLEKHGTWQGQSEHIILDDPARQIRQFQVQIRAGNDTLQVYSAEGEPHCVSGNTLSATGVRIENVVAAGNTSVQGTAEVAAAGCSTLGAQNTAVLLVQFPTIGLPTGVTKSGVWDIFFAGSGRSVDGYWKEASYGKASATGDVFGPFTLDRTYTCDEYYSMLGAAITAADPFVNFPSYTRIFVVFPNPGTCGWAGMGMLSCSTFSSADGNFTASASWLLATYMTSRDTGVKLATHEGGHNLTLNHSSSRAYTGEALGPLSAAGTLSEYGDSLATMGYWNLGHYAAQHKVQMGWLSPSNVITTESNGSYGILPLETPTAGVQAVKVRRGAGNDAWLWVEYRQPTGNYDNSLSGIFSGGLVHYQDSTTGTHTHLVDFTPASTAGFADPALTGTWVDPYTNLSLSVTGATSSALSLNVSYGAQPCAVVQPTVTLSPANPSGVSGTAVTYTVSVKNNDAGGCTSSTFTLSSSLPSGWSTGFSPGTLTLSPGQTATATMTENIPVAFTPGTYGVNATASDAKHSATGTANITVTAPPCTIVQPTVTLSPGSQSGTSGTPLTYSMSVTNKDSSGCSTTTFTLSSSLPTGWSTSFSPGAITLSPGQTASAIITKNIPANFTPGTYGIDATASDAKHSANGSASITVTALCTVAQPIVTISPANPSANPGTAVPYTVSVRNNDSASCSSSTFSLSSSLPSGWSSGFSPATLTLSPGQTASATLTKSIPATATPGLLPVDAAVSDANHLMTGTASITVVALPIVIQVTATPAKVKARDTVTIQATVTNAIGPVSSASVTFDLTRPNGPLTQAATTNSSGVATWLFKTQQKGNYSVTAAATSNGASATSSAAPFVAQ